MQGKGLGENEASWGWGWEVGELSLGQPSRWRVLEGT